MMNIIIVMKIIVGVVLFVIGLLGCVITKRNLVIVLMSIELMLMGVSINYAFISIDIGDIFGQVMALFILVVAAAETSIGLGMIVMYHRLLGSVNVSKMSQLKG